MEYLKTIDKKTLTKYRRTLQTIRSRGKILSESFGSMGQCQRRKGFTLSEDEALLYLIKEFPIFPINSKQEDE